MRKARPPPPSHPPNARARGVTGHHTIPVTCDGAVQPVHPYQMINDLSILERVMFSAGRGDIFKQLVDGDAKGRGKAWGSSCRLGGRPTVTWGHAECERRVQRERAKSR